MVVADMYDLETSGYIVGTRYLLPIIIPIEFTLENLHTLKAERLLNNKSSELHFNINLSGFFLSIY